MVLSLFEMLSCRLPGHIGAALGCVAANWRIRLRMVRYSRRGITTSAVLALLEIPPQKIRERPDVGGEVIGCI
jgi:hypothetical protein